MNTILNLINALTGAAPLVLSTLILGVSLIAFIYAMIRIVMPAMRETNTAFHVQRESWASLIDEQNRINQWLTEGLQKDLLDERDERGKLGARVAGLEAELEEKTRQLDTANSRIAEMQKDLDEVQADREKVTRERDSLRSQVKQLHREVAQLRRRLNKLPAQGDASTGTSANH